MNWQNNANTNYQQVDKGDIYCNNNSDVLISGGVYYNMSTPNLGEVVCIPINPTDTTKQAGMECQVRSNTSPYLVWHMWALCSTP